MSNILYSVDVEPDLHDGRFRGIQEGLAEFEKICDRHKVRPALFVVASLLENNDNVKTLKRLNKKGWEISLHGYSHKRFDDLCRNEKEEEIKRSIELFRKKLGIRPKGFRAPQHSIDRETLDLLEEYKFEYDSSYTPLNLLQLFFFPKRPGHFLRGFFSRTNPYSIRKNLIEIPVSSIFLPPVSIVVRVFPTWFLKVYFSVLKRLYKNPVFYAHSWDFIEMKESRIDRIFPYYKLLEKLDSIFLFVKNENKNK